MRRSPGLLALFLLLSVSALADSVLVLPFFSLSPASENLDWISESVSETLREAIYGQGFLVVDRQDLKEVYRRLSIRPYARLTRASVIKVGDTLDAGTVIYGEVELLPKSEPASGSRGSLRITARVLDLKRLTQSPEFSEVGPLEDLTRLQSHLAWETLRVLAPQATPSEEEFRKVVPIVRLDAMENYIRGLLATDSEQKHRFFTQAARLDEDFSQPCFELGRLYWRKKEYRFAAGWLAKVKPGSPNYFEANFLLGLCRYYTADYDKAAAAFELVARSVPLNEVFNNLGAAQSRSELPQALENFQKALEGDTADPDYQFNVGYALWKQGNFEAAADRFRAVLERTPDDSKAVLMLGRCLKRSGPRPGETAKSDGLVRLKQNFEERAYRELKAALEIKKK